MGTISDSTHIKGLRSSHHISKNNVFKYHIKSIPPKLKLIKVVSSGPSASRLPKSNIPLPFGDKVTSKNSQLQTLAKIRLRAVIKLTPGVLSPKARPLLSTMDKASIPIANDVTSQSLPVSPNGVQYQLKISLTLT